MSNKAVLTLGNRRLVSRAASRIMALQVLRDEWETYLDENGKVSELDIVQLNILGHDLLSAIHSVQGAIPEVSEACSKAEMGEVKSEVTRALTEDNVSPERQTQILAKFDKFATSHKGWDSVFRSLDENLDKEAVSVRERMTGKGAGNPIKAAFGEGACCSIGFALCGAGFALRSKLLIKIGNAMVERCC
jgi:hypothetical protein